MAVIVSVAIKVLQGGETVMVNAERSQMVLNPRPRDLGNDGDLAKETLEKVLAEMGQEADEQIGAWKEATFNILGGGSSS